MKILNVSSTIDSVTGGGEAERTYQMSKFLTQAGVTCRLLTTNTGLPVERKRFLGVDGVVALPRLIKRFYVPTLSFRRISSLVREADVVHLMGHWGILNALTYLAARRLGKPYVVCPAGALPLFGRSKLLKRFFNLIIGHAIIQNASGWIAVTKAEFPQFEEYGIPRSRVTVIPNGVSEEDFPIVDVAEFKRKHSLPDAPIILFVGRLNPIKGPDLLLAAFLKVRSTLPNHHLVFVGPDGGMQASMQATIDEAGAAENVHFLGFVGGADKSAAYRMAELLVVPSRQEAMSIVAIEAGICGVPVLLTDQCGFGEIRSIDPRLEVPVTVNGLAEGLTSLLCAPATLKSIAPTWTSFVQSRYSWDSLIPEYIRLYQSICDKAQHY